MIHNNLYVEDSPDSGSAYKIFDDNQTTIEELLMIQREWKNSRRLVDMAIRCIAQPRSQGLSSSRERGCALLSTILAQKKSTQTSKI